LLLPPDRLRTVLDPPGLLRLPVLGRGFTDFRDVLPEDSFLVRLTEPPPERGLAPDSYFRPLLDPGRTVPDRVFRSPEEPEPRVFQMRVPFLRGSTVLMLPRPASPLRERAVVPGLPFTCRERLPMEPPPPRLSRGVLVSRVRPGARVARLSDPAAVCRIPEPALLRVRPATPAPSRIFRPGFPRTRLADA
jgi:hypothetical protein